MARVEILTVIVAVALAPVLAGCGSSREAADNDGATTGQIVALARPSQIPRPEFYGLYAITNGRLIRLDGASNWEVETWPARENLPTDTIFVIFDPSLARSATPLREYLQLRQVARVRNAVVLSTATVRPLEQDEWVAPDLPPFRVSLEFSPVEGHHDMVVALPQRRLDPGLYEIQLRQQPVLTTGRFGVNWKSVNQTAYATTYCVDRFQGANEPYGLCSLTATR